MKHVIALWLCALLCHVSQAYAEIRFIVQFKAPDAAPTPRSTHAFSSKQLQSLADNSQKTIYYRQAIGATGAHVISLDEPNTPANKATLRQKLLQTPGITSVEEDVMLHIAFAPADPFYSNQWNLMAPPSTSNTSTTYGADFADAWNLGPGYNGSGVVVAIVDTGITPHPDLGLIDNTSGLSTGNLVSAGHDFISDCWVAGECSLSSTNKARLPQAVQMALDEGDYVSASDQAALGNSYDPNSCRSTSSWHGTHVAGIIAAEANTIGVIGGAYHAKTLPVRALGKCGGYLSDIINGYLWAAGLHPSLANPNPAQVINMSLAGTSPCIPALQAAIDAAYAMGVTTVVAAGNTASDASGFTPANCHHVIPVAAIGPSGAIAPYSNGGPLIALSAPGGDETSGPSGGVFSTLYGQPGAFSFSDFGNLNSANWTYNFLQGTSMAAPHVSAATALLLQRFPGIDPASVSTALSNTTPFPNNTNSCTLQGVSVSPCGGAGILNAFAALQPSASIFPGNSNLGDVQQPLTLSQPEWVINAGSSPVTLGNNAITLSGSSNFSVTTDHCSNTTLSPGATCGLIITYNGAGSDSVLLTVPAMPAVQATVTAHGILPSVTTRYNFGISAIGKSVVGTLTFTNPSATLDLPIAKLLINPNDASLTISSTTCVGVLPHGSSCSVTIVYSPTSVAQLNSSLTLTTASWTGVIQMTGTSSALPGSSNSGTITPELLMGLAGLILRRLYSYKQSSHRSG